MKPSQIKVKISELSPSIRKELLKQTPSYIKKKGVNKLKTLGIKSYNDLNKYSEQKGWKGSVNDKLTKIVGEDAAMWILHDLSMNEEYDEV